MTATLTSITTDPLPPISELQERLIKEGKLTDPASPRGRLLQHAAQLFRTKGSGGPARTLCRRWLRTSWKFSTEEAWLDPQ